MQVKNNTKAQSAIWAMGEHTGFAIGVNMGGVVKELDILMLPDGKVAVIRRVDGNPVHETVKLDPDKAQFYVERRLRLASKHKYDRKTAYGTVPVARLGVPAMTFKEIIAIKGFEHLEGKKVLKSWRAQYKAGADIRETLKGLYD